MSDPVWPEGFKELWDAIAPAVHEAVTDGNYLRDTPEVRRRLGEADELAEKLDD